MFNFFLYSFCYFLSRQSFRLQKKQATSQQLEWITSETRVLTKYVDLMKHRLWIKSTILSYYSKLGLGVHASRTQIAGHSRPLSARSAEPAGAVRSGLGQPEATRHRPRPLRLSDALARSQREALLLRALVQCGRGDAARLHADGWRGMHQIRLHLQSAKVSAISRLNLSLLFSDNKKQQQQKKGNVHIDKR